MPSKLRAPVHSGELGNVVQRIYDDLNTVIESMNTDLEGIKEPDEKTKSGGLAVVKEGDKYSLRGKTADGWARVNMRLLNSSKIKNLNTSNKFVSNDDIIFLTDSTGGTAADTIPASGGSWDDSEINVAIASLASKTNELVTLINTHNNRINTLIDKTNEILRRIDG
jgi:hypothetical protein